MKSTNEMDPTNNTTAAEIIVLKALNETMLLCADSMRCCYETTFQQKFQNSADHKKLLRRTGTPICCQHHLADSAEYYYYCSNSPGKPFFLAHLKSEGNEMVYYAYHAAKELLMPWPNRRQSQLLRKFSVFYNRYIPKAFATTPVYCLKNTQAEHLLSEAFMTYCLSPNEEKHPSREPMTPIETPEKKSTNTTSHEKKRLCKAKTTTTIRYRFGVDPTGDKEFKQFLEAGKASS